MLKVAEDLSFIYWLDPPAIGWKRFFGAPKLPLVKKGLVLRFDPKLVMVADWPRVELILG